MDDAALVRGVERVGHLDADVEQAVEAERAAGDPPVQRLALEQFHRDEALAGGFFDRVNRADVRVIERAGGAGLTLKTLQRRRVARELGWQKLQRNPPPELRVERFIHDAHATAAEGPDD
jgi:hypothetical protein